MKRGYLPSWPEALATAPRHAFGGSMPPERLDRSGIDIVPALYGNDVYGDCTCVSYTNYARCVSKLNGVDLVVDPGAPLQAYAGVLGNPPNLMATEGAMPMDVLIWQGRNGFDVGPQKLVALQGLVAPNRIAMASAINRFGGLWFGMILHARDEATTDTWTTTGERGDITGGHMMNAWDYTGLSDADTVRVGTWARWQAVTWPWMEEAIEAHGLVWRSLADAAGLFYSGLTADGLVAELAA
jgi:hypothetical protein